MTYFPLSDEFHSMPELIGASDAAVALYARAASWSAFHLTDGHVPSKALPLLTASYEQAPVELVERRVWKRSRGGFQFVTWPKQVTRSNVEAQREASRRRQQKFRSAEGDLSRRDTPVSNTVTNGVTNGVSHSAHATPRHTTELSTESSPYSPHDRFDEFWSIYPCKKAKKAARKSWQRALKDADADTIINGARRYAESRSGQDPKYTAMPTTWLNQGRWEDEPTGAEWSPSSTNGYRPWTNPTDPSAYEGQL